MGGSSPLPPFSSLDFHPLKPIYYKVMGPKIGILDIETAPILAAVWKLWDENVGLEQIVNDWYILSFSFKWLHSKHITHMDKSKSWNTEDDKDLLHALWALLMEADVIVAQNGKQFDIKKINARFLLNGMKPPSPYKVVDTCEIAKRVFGFTSNKLQYMTEKLCKTKKLVHNKFPGYLLWQQCLKGNQAAWKEMKKYNIHDVLSLEELYLVMLPWIVDHPTHALYVDSSSPSCNKCGSVEVEKRGTYKTQTSVYQRYHCTSCGGWLRSKELLISSAKRKTLLTGV